MKRRDFLKKATLASVGSVLTLTNVDAMERLANAPFFNINRKGKSEK